MLLKNYTRKPSIYILYFNNIWKSIKIIVKSISIRLQKDKPSATDNSYKKVETDSTLSFIPGYKREYKKHLLATIDELCKQMKQLTVFPLNVSKDPHNDTEDLLHGLNKGKGKASVEDFSYQPPYVYDLSNYNDFFISTNPNKHAGIKFHSSRKEDTIYFIHLLWYLRQFYNRN